MHVDDAISFIIDVVKHSMTSNNHNESYDLDLRSVTTKYLTEVEHCSDHFQYVQDHPRGKELSTYFYDGAWELCRRGILRPSVRVVGWQGSAGGDGYSITKFGRTWISEGANPDELIYGADRFTELFKKLSRELGGGFLQRATEAARCYNLGVHIACCAMCGAAAESILLAVAITKSGDEHGILASYRTASGRKKVVDVIVGQATQALADQFKSATSLLSYWRDDAAHGLPSTISEIEAHEAVSRLLRFAQFAVDNWAELTRR
jgi:hypothetical protein